VKLHRRTLNVFLCGAAAVFVLGEVYVIAHAGMYDAGPNIAGMISVAIWAVALAAGGAMLAAIVAWRQGTRPQ
jgi:hypothetical protein